jgi:hypothetical protein
LIARPTAEVELVGTEELLERLDRPEAALDNLARLCGVEGAAFCRTDGWAAVVDLDGTTVLVRGDARAWGVYLMAGADDDDGMRTARRIHGLLGEQADGWDDDR